MYWLFPPKKSSNANKTKEPDQEYFHFDDNMTAEVKKKVISGKVKELLNSGDIHIHDGCLRAGADPKLYGLHNKTNVKEYITAVKNYKLDFDKSLDKIKASDVQVQHNKYLEESYGTGYFLSEYDSETLELDHLEDQENYKEQDGISFGSFAGRFIKALTIFTAANSLIRGVTSKIRLHPDNDFTPYNLKTMLDGKASETSGLKTINASDSGFMQSLRAEPNKLPMLGKFPNSHTLKDISEINYALDNAGKITSVSNIDLYRKEIETIQSTVERYKSKYLELESHSQLKETTKPSVKDKVAHELNEIDKDLKGVMNDLSGKVERDKDVEVGEDTVHHSLFYNSGEEERKLDVVVREVSNGGKNKIENRLDRVLIQESKYNALSSIEKLSFVLKHPSIAIRLGIFDTSRQKAPDAYEQWEITGAHSENGTTISSMLKGYKFVQDHYDDTLSCKWISDLRRASGFRKYTLNKNAFQNVDLGLITTQSGAKFGLPPKTNLEPIRKTLQHINSTCEELKKPSWFTINQVENTVEALKFSESSDNMLKACVTKLINNYNNDKSLGSLVKLVTSLERMHIFPDYNARTFGALVLNKELIQMKKNPSILTDVNYLDYYSDKDLIKEIESGQTDFKHLALNGVVNTNDPSNATWLKNFTIIKTVQNAICLLKNGEALSKTHFKAKDIILSMLTCAENDIKLISYSKKTNSKKTKLPALPITPYKTKITADEYDNLGKTIILTNVVCEAGYLELIKHKVVKSWIMNLGSDDLSLLKCWYSLYTAARNQVLSPLLKPLLKSVGHHKDDFVKRIITDLESDSFKVNCNDFKFFTGKGLDHVERNDSSVLGDDDFLDS